MLFPLRPGELNTLIPAVATGNQFKYALGNPRKILQRILISSIGGVITLLISQNQESSPFHPLWLMSGVAFLIYILWGPILEASLINSKVRKYPIAALFYGRILNIYTKEKVEKRTEQASKTGSLEIVEDRRTWMFLELGDEDGYLGKVNFPMEKAYSILREGENIACLVLGNRKDFSQISAITDAWLPRKNLWVGDYPYLLRPAFIELCNRYI